MHTFNPKQMEKQSANQLPAFLYIVISRLISDPLIICE